MTEEKFRISGFEFQVSNFTFRISSGNSNTQMAGTRTRGMPSVILCAVCRVKALLLVPTEHPQRAQRVPATRFAYRFVEREGERLVVGVIEEPSAVGLTLALDETEGFVDTRIWAVAILKRGVPEVMEGAQDVIAVARREGELQEVGVRHFAGGEPSEECAFEQVLLAASPCGRDLRRAGDGRFILEQALEHADRGVE